MLYKNNPFLKKTIDGTLRKNLKRKKECDQFCMPNITEKMKYLKHCPLASWASKKPSTNFISHNIKQS